MAKIIPAAERSKQLASEYGALATELISESDRGCVLLGCTFIEEALEHAIRDKFKELSPADDVDDHLDILLINEPAPPLGSFAMRIRMAYVLGAIGNEMREALVYLKGIRNGFAHRPKRKADKPPKLTGEIAKEMVMHSMKATFSDGESKTISITPSAVKSVRDAFRDKEGNAPSSAHVHVCLSVLSILGFLIGE